MKSLVFKKAFFGVLILALFILSIFGEGWWPPYLMYSILLLCAVRLWLLEKKKTLLICLLIFLIDQNSHFILFIQENEAVPIWKVIITFGLTAAAVIAFIYMIYVSLAGNLPVKKDEHKSK